MPAQFKSSADAIAALAARFQAAIRCVANVHVFWNTVASGRIGSLTFVQQGTASNTGLSLRTSAGRGDLELVLYHDFVIDDVELARSRRYLARTTSYFYDVQDRNEREIIVFHWHPNIPGGRSFPHVHISGARPIPLAARPSGEAPPPLDISNAHIPTGVIEIEEVLQVLIRDLGVQPLRADWEPVLAENLRAARETQPE